jgi:hypothetical protein
MFFKKSSPSDTFLKRLSPIYGEVAGIIKEIDGPFVKLYEAGIFVASIATLKIISLNVENADELADEFNSKWLDYICGSYEVNGKSPDKNLLISRLQEKYPIYSELFLKVVDPQNDDEKRHNASVQLTWELFTNCTDKKAPDSPHFTNLVLCSGHIVKSALDVFEKIKK